MKTWEDWSDFEINKAVVCALGLKILRIWTVKPNVFITLGSSEASKKVDYCNNPADMWPIIVDNSITINYDTCQAHVSSYFNEAIKISVSRNRVLRAAAIVFLMMNGVNPE